MLRYRLMAAGVLIAILLSVCWFDFRYPLDSQRGGIWLLPIALILAAAGAGELLRLFAAVRIRPIEWMVHVANVLIIGSSAIAPLWPGYPADCAIGQFGWPLAALAISATVMMAGELYRYEKSRTDLKSLTGGMFILVYLSVPFCFVVALRTFGDNTQGMVALFSFVLVVKMGDTGAYFGGRTFGGKWFGPRRPVPRLSPKKTFEGYLCGMVTAVAASWIMLTLVAPIIIGEKGANSPWWGCVLYGIVLAVAGMLGDLIESYLKRQAQQKDSSSWLPGLGGVMDILDSLLPAAPLAYLMWVAGIVSVSS